jgi:hypothetical protein
MRWPDELYDELLARLRGHSVGLAVNRFGNFGDGLIQRGTLELLQRHGITCRLLRDDEIALSPSLAEVILAPVLACPVPNAVCNWPSCPARKSFSRNRRPIPMRI